MSDYLTQYINANCNLYFNENFDERYLEEFNEKFFLFRRQEKAFTEEISELKKDEFETYISFEEVGVKCKLKLSFIGLLLKTHKILNKIKKNENMTFYRTLEVKELADKIRDSKGK